MSVIVAPTYSFEAVTPHDFDSFATVLDAPIMAVDLAQKIVGEPVVFDAGADPHIVPVPIPHLPGLDEIELERASFSIASAPYIRTQSVSANAPANGAVGVTLSGVATGQTVGLSQVSLTGLTTTPPSSVSYALKASGATIYWTRNADGDVITTTSNPGGTVQHLHILIRPGSGGSAGPPIAAAPHFNMPGAGRGLYGPALGGAALSVVRHNTGLVDATLTMTPTQPMTGCTVLIGTAAAGNAAINAHQGLPTEVADINWSAHNAEARFDTRAQAITVTTHSGATAPDQGALVAGFETDPGSTFRVVDFAPAARVALNEGYPSATGSDLGLALRVQVDTPGALHLSLGSVAARYVQCPLPLPPTLALRGAPEAIEIPVPQGLRPQGLSFRVDGSYGPVRLTADADMAPAAMRDGFRISGPRRAARQVLLNANEAALPLARFAVFGRASEDCELLITRHGGDDARIGPAIGAPQSLIVGASDGVAWHRVDVPLRDGLPPHAQSIWLTVQAMRGDFWWYADLDAQVSPTQLSQDEGVSWSKALGRPLMQVSVREVDAATGDPAPLTPLSLSRMAGVLNADIVGVAAGTAAPDFTRLWVAEGSAHVSLLDDIAQSDGALTLSLFSTRDVDLSVTDVVLTYDPWTAKVTP